MDGKAIHRCLHVLDLEKSIAFYEKALGMTEIRRMGPEDGSWTNVFMGSDASGFQLELTWNRGRTEPYDNGGRDSHLAFTVDDYEAARALHEEMGCICHVNEAMGLYFIEDPDGCWLEILPNKAEFAPQAGVDVLDAMARRRSLRRRLGPRVAIEQNRVHIVGLDLAQRALQIVQIQGEAQRVLRLVQPAHHVVVAPAAHHRARDALHIALEHQPIVIIQIVHHGKIYAHAAQIV